MHLIGKNSHQDTSRTAWNESGRWFKLQWQPTARPGEKTQGWAQNKTYDTVLCLSVFEKWNLLNGDLWQFAGSNSTLISLSSSRAHGIIYIYIEPSIYLWPKEYKEIQVIVNKENSSVFWGVKMVFLYQVPEGQRLFTLHQLLVRYAWTHIYVLGYTKVQMSLQRSIKVKWIKLLSAL